MAAFLVIVDDLYVVRIGSEPAEADAPLIVDSDAVLASPVPGEFLEAIRGRNAEVEEAGRESCGSLGDSNARRYYVQVATKRPGA